MNERIQGNDKSKSVTMASNWKLFDHPHLLPGEDAATYEELLARFRAAINPVDIIDDMFIADVVASEWEALRSRRFKTSLIRTAGLRALKYFLRAEYHLSEDGFTHSLTKILQENVPEDQSQDCARLARACAQNEPEAVDKVNQILEDTDCDLDRIRQDAHNEEMGKLVQEYLRREPEAIKKLEEVFAKFDMTLDSFFYNSLSDPEKLSNVERIDRLATIAEGRRNASLREIDRRHAALGQAVRQAAREIEGEFKLIDSKSSKGEEAI
jgi:hypothetical protein